MSVTRHGNVWELSFNGMEARAMLPIEAFKSLRGRPLGPEEWRALHCVFVRDRSVQSKIGR